MITLNFHSCLKGYSLNQYWRWGRTDPFCLFSLFSLSPFRRPPDAMLEPSRPLRRRHFSAHGDGGEGLACSETDWERKRKKTCRMVNVPFVCCVGERGGVARKRKPFLDGTARQEYLLNMVCVRLVRERHTYWICCAWRPQQNRKGTFPRPACINQTLCFLKTG